MTLKTAREAVGLSQIGLDAAASLPKGTVWDIESGRNGNPTLAVALALVDALKKAGLKALTIEMLFAHSEVRS